MAYRGQILNGMSLKVRREQVQQHRERLLDAAGAYVASVASMASASPRS